MDDHVATVASIYDAFGRGDLPAILAVLSDDVRWEEWADNHAQGADVPWLRPRTGKNGVLEFFAVAGELTIHELRALSLLAGGNQVAAEVVVDATLP